MSDYLRKVLSGEKGVGIRGSGSGNNQKSYTTMDSNLSTITDASMALAHGGMKLELFPEAWQIFSYGPNKEKPIVLVGAIDQGTSSTRFMAFTTHGKVAASAQIEHTQIFPEGSDKVGWHEHNPFEIWDKVCETMKAVSTALKDGGVDFQFETIGITNQRETTVAWNKKTGVPYYNAIVWDDTRTGHIANVISAGNANRLRERTGLPVTTYFAGCKIRWMLDNVEELASDLKSKPHEVCFGTIDSWLLYLLTSTAMTEKDSKAYFTGGKFATDVTNASRWLFMDINKVKWDKSLVDAICRPHNVPLTTLPKICPSAHVFGNISHTASGIIGINDIETYDGVKIGSILGDQQSALFGQVAFEQGEAKNTYGTGLFLMMNTGTKPVQSTHGLLTTIAYQIGETGKVYYALEGSVSHSGSTIQWLRDQLNVIEKASESEILACTTKDNGGLYMVPAFAGLFAPHWRSDARACIVGMTATHHRGHLCRAALEATAYQTREVFDAIQADSGVTLSTIKVDGGATANNLLMQFQADIINVEVVKPQILDTTALGTAFAAGLAVGVWKSLEEIKALWSISKVYKPLMSDEERNKNWQGWNMAVTRSLGWVVDGESNGDVNVNVPSFLTEDGDESTANFQDALEDIGGGTGRGQSGTAAAATTTARHMNKTSYWGTTLTVIAISGIAGVVGFQLGRDGGTKSLKSLSKNLNFRF